MRPICGVSHDVAFGMSIREAHGGKGASISCPLPSTDVVQMQKWLSLSKDARLGIKGWASSLAPAAS